MRPGLRGSPVSVGELPAAALVDLGNQPYSRVHQLQRALVARRRAGGAAEDVFLVTEHPGVFTLGRRGGRENLLVTPTFLDQAEIALVEVERGGDVTYHGPGQLVLYPILHLAQAGMRVAEYVWRLEEVMIRLAAACGVTAGRNPRNHGVWVAERKLGSVGIAVRHGVAFHGMAINISLSLTPFSWVNPCGLAGVQMTSLCRETGMDLEMATVKAGLEDHLPAIFDRAFIRMPQEYGDALIDETTPEH